MANKQYASLIRKTFHDRNCLSIYIKQYKSQRQKWKDTKIQEDKMKELQSLQPAVFSLPQHGTMQGFIRLQFLRTKCSERALLSTFWVLFLVLFYAFLSAFLGTFLSTFFRTLKSFKVTQNLPSNMEQCRGLSYCNSCAPNALKRLNLKLHQNGFNFIFWDLTHKWYEKIGSV